MSPVTLTGVAICPHQIRLTKAGYQDYTTTVMVRGLSPDTVTATLTSISKGTMAYSRIF